MKYYNPLSTTNETKIKLLEAIYNNKLRPMLVSFCINNKEKLGSPFLYPLVLSTSGHRATLGLILMQ